MCRVLHVSEQGYYRSLRRPEKRAQDQQLLEQIWQCLQEDTENGDNYGVRRIIAWLRIHRAYTGGSRRIYRICREHHLTIRPKRRPHGLTKADRQAEKSQNLIKQDFTADKPNEKWSCQEKFSVQMQGFWRCAAVIQAAGCWTVSKYLLLKTSGGQPPLTDVILRRL